MTTQGKQTEECPYCGGDGRHTVGDGDRDGGCHEEDCSTCGGTGKLTQADLDRINATRPINLPDADELPF